MLSDLKNKFHFSIDDIFYSFVDLKTQNIKIRDHFLLGKLFKYYENYGLMTSLYCFTQNKIGSKIMKIESFLNPKMILEEYKWLKFGYHAKQFEIAPYAMKTNALKNDFKKFYDFISDKKLFSQYLRFHYYSEMFELKNELFSCNIRGLFTTDKKEISYRIADEGKKSIQKKGYYIFNEIFFIRTQFRIENFSLLNLNRTKITKLLESQLKKYGFIIIYVHEYDLYNLKTLQYLDLTLDILFKDLKIKSFIQ